ncbi:MAG TPA: CocE/NonD family hydrolase, partial [Gemmatimonadaceae bacterium]|nr:CocE/NonD family hydrolase [Gemmatimonadaceae bacterium]
LKAMAPAMTFASPWQFWYSGGVWDNSWIAWIYNNIAPDRRKRLGLLPETPWDSVRDRLRTTVPLLSLKDLEGVAPWYYEWLKHPAYDPWWNWAELRDKYGRTSAAVLNFSAWHDEAYGPHGATTNFAGLVAARRGSPARSALIMGPWSHGVPRMGRTAVGEREYGPAGSLDYDETILRWMDRYVRNIDNGVDHEKPVRVFVLGSNKWITSDAWPIPGTTPDTIIFEKVSESTVFAADPKNPVVDPYAETAGAHDYRDIVRRNDVVFFDTKPLTSDLTVVGAMRAEVAISTDAPDVDIWAKVYDVGPDGTAYNLMSPGLDVVRASYRRATAQRDLLKPGTIYRVSLGDLLAANTFKRGHMIRLAIMTTFAPHFTRNLQTGELESTSAASRVAHVTIHHNDLRPLRLILPVLPASVMLSADK